MKIGFVQNNPCFGEIERNLSQLDELTHGIRCDVLVLPELFATGYLFRDRDEVAQYAEVAGEGSISRYVQTLASRIDGMVIAGFAEKAQEQYFNSAMVFTPHGLEGVYRKMHLFDRERLCFDETDYGFHLFSHRGVKIGVMICFDWHFPESARTLALMGADIIAHPSNLVLPHCPEAMKTRALENRVFTITANRVGEDNRDFDTLGFIGCSRIYSPKGVLLAKGTEEQLTVEIVDIDPTEARDKQVTSRNNLFEDRRKEHYKLN